MSVVQPGVDETAGTHKSGFRLFLLIVALLLAGVVSYYVKARIAGMHPGFIRQSVPGVLAFAQYVLGDYRAAAGRYREHFAKYETLAEPGGQADLDLLLRGDTRGAERLADGRLSANPANGEALLTLAEASLARGDLDRASEYVERLRAIRPRSLRDDATAYLPQHEAWLVGALIEIRRARYDAALDSLHEFLRAPRPPRRVTIYLALLDATGEVGSAPASVRPNDLLTYLHRYLALYDRAQRRRVVEHAERAIDARQRADLAHLAIAAQALARGSTDRALGHLRRAVQLNPANAEAYYRSALIYGDRGDLVNALRMLEQAHAARPRELDYLDALVKFLSQQVGELTRATLVVDEFLAGQGRQAQAFFWAGHLRWMTGDIAGSTRFYTSALELEPDDAPVLENLAHNFVRQARIEEAIGTYRRAIAAAPTRASSHRQLAGLFMDQMRYLEATQEFEAAFALQKPSTGDLARLCAMYHAGSRFADARDCFRRVLARDSGNELARRLMPEVMRNLDAQQRRQ